ncbi:DNA gyrase subunit A [Candidatus Poribacteria bacterium]|nr:DNA gyrase subunit A [Candidatus Poribacteria bacterium]MBT5535507.1 DNA gyrase subunit A [Candidatus Poribacteria bacterium]MBT5712788.1 DNA gyrase subunit A [Candidatus Poribacteria bacterium]MBT7096483.1 DNA gyrase subunit A [Candidatus Poribacteria bacterium]MBT7807193.1 DNA gyrase subunit A [Candidatus Poribacteria bacterium]
MDDRGGHVITRQIEDELRDAYLTYAVNVNTNRAIPDVRDGLKPSSRRILYAMHDEGLTSDRPFDKCAGVVGEVMKNYHPHGNEPIYETLVGLAQEFTMRYPLLDYQGNFGSIDGDPPGAMRYTEVRMQKLAAEMLVDIGRDTVDFRPNYKESTTEPGVLPARLPNLLVNGTTGIGVGYMTRIPPQNLGEVVDALTHYIDHPDATLDDLREHIHGPDFPTGGIILGQQGIRDAYSTGQGGITLRAKTMIERGKDRESIIVTEIPYHTKKNKLLESIAHVVNEKIVEGISDVRDESDRSIRVVIELKRGEIAQVILNQLFKHTPLQTTFSVLMLCLVDGRPKQLNLQEMLYHYIEHRREVVRRRTAYELRRGEARLHILEGYRTALTYIDEIIEIVQASTAPAEARIALVERFDLTEVQASEILALTLGRLTGLERQKINDEYTDLLVKVEEYRAILESDLLVRNIVKEELLTLKEEFGDERRTQIIDDPGEFSMEDLIVDEKVVITLSDTGYIKRLPVSTYKSQRRGGVGVRGMATKEDDYVESLLVASNHQYLLCFTSSGRCYWLRVFEIPEASRQSRGRALINLLNLSRDESIARVVPLREFAEDDDRTLFFATKKGIVKRCSVRDFSRPLSSGIIAMGFRTESDYLMDVLLTEPRQDIAMVTSNGMSIRFAQSEVRVMGRTAQGVRGVRLRDGDELVRIAAVEPEIDPDAADEAAEPADSFLLVVTCNGYGKRTPMSEYRLQSRDGVGIITIKTNDRNGEVVGARLVSESDDLLVISSNGYMTRMAVSDIRAIGRNTQGVRIMSLQENERIQGIARLPKDEDDEVNRQEKAIEAEES